MENVQTTAKETGWRPIPLPLKILSFIFILWSVGAVLNAPNLYESGLPLLGTFIFGMSALAVVLFFDVIGPIVFLFALWTRKSWAVKWAFFYIGLFVLNSVVALFTISEELGLPQILIPTIVSVVFLSIIYWKRSYFR